MNDNDFDHLLNVETGRDRNAAQPFHHYHPYEPTPYAALEVLSEHYPLKSSDRIVDYGCGKGRLNFYVNNKFDASAIGIEMNERFYREALHNRERYLKTRKKQQGRLTFKWCLAQDYVIQETDNRFYFFNPFSKQIFMKVIQRILLSAEKAPREIDIILYYPHKDYLSFLNDRTAFKCIKEIILPEKYQKDENERFLVYRLAY